MKTKAVNSNFLLAFGESVTNFDVKSRSSSWTRSFKSKNFKSWGMKIVILVIVLAVVAGVFLLGKGVMAYFQGGSTQNKSTLAKPRATQEVNRDFSFPLRDQKGETVSSIKYFVTSAEIVDQIIVKGQKASLVSGRTFLVVNLKVTNSYTKNIQINTRDYVRLVVNGNEKEILAPEIHNDPVEVQAGSTKFTRIGFTINNSDKDLKLRIGEIDQQSKVNIDLKFGQP